MPSQPDKQFDLVEVAELALNELGRRLMNDPASVGETALSKMLSDINRIMDRRDKEIEEEESKPFNLLDELPTLPKDRALKLAQQELARLSTEVNRWVRVVTNLEEGTPDGRAEGVGAGQGERAGEGA